MATGHENGGWMNDDQRSATKNAVQEPEAESQRRSTDPELLAMGRMIRLLDDLEGPARARVVAYLSDRYRVLP